MLCNQTSLYIIHRVYTGQYLEYLDRRGDRQMEQVPAQHCVMFYSVSLQQISFIRHGRKQTEQLHCLSSDTTISVCVVR